MARLSTESYHIITQHPVVLVVVIFICALAAFGYVAWDEYYKVKHMRREPMSICDKHGAFPSKLNVTISTLPADYDQQGNWHPELNVEACPICMQERAKAAKEKARG